MASQLRNILYLCYRFIHRHDRYSKIVFTRTAVERIVISFKKLFQTLVKDNIVHLEIKETGLTKLFEVCIIHWHRNITIDTISNNVRIANT